MEEHKSCRFALGMSGVRLLWQGENCMIKGRKEQ